MDSVGARERGIGQQREGVGHAPRGVDDLARALVDARDYTRRMYAHLTPEQQAFPQIPIVNLPRWEVGHVGWF
jgi:hypothetical protein